MKAKVFKDGERIIISFEGIKDVEAFLQKVVEIASTPETTVVPEEVPHLEHPEEIKEPELIDFEAPFTGKTLDEIINTENFEGYYFLCRTKIPPQYKEECSRILVNFFNSKKILYPPKTPDRMKKYLAMARKILGGIVIPEEALNIEEVGMLVTACEYASEKLTDFYNNLQ